jgi:hypothetical protein
MECDASIDPKTERVIVAFSAVGYHNARASQGHASSQLQRGQVSVDWQQRPLDLPDQDGAHPTLHARTLGIPRLQLFWAKNPTLADPFLDELIASDPLQRLRHIGFLGAIDYLVHGNGQAPHRRRHNRFDHSVNVALLALRYALLRELDTGETRALVSAALLHDIGHGPLSHTLEPVFCSLFDTDHHRAGQSILEGRSCLGSAIPQIFVRHGVDLDEVLVLLSGSHTGPHAFLFDSPMNFDTIEAIARCCLFSKAPREVLPTNFVDAIAIQHDFPVEMGDRFWDCKGTVYKTVIGSRTGVAADTLAQRYMVAHAGRFDESDFYLDDIQLRRKHPDLFTLFETLRNPGESAEDRSSRFRILDLDCEIEARARRFTINKATHVQSPRDLAIRYTQEKTRYKVSLKSLISRAHQLSEQPLLHGIEWIRAD